jgi:cytochrome P450
VDGFYTALQHHIGAAPPAGFVTAFNNTRPDHSGSYMRFGTGHRICVGAAFATIESDLILAGLVSRYDFEAIAPNHVRPVARLTTRPAKHIMIRIRLRR